MQVLIADDEPVTRTILKEALTRAGYDVLVARDGREAVATLRATACQLVVSDWEMPRRGRQFDPDMINAFLATEPLFIEVRQRFADEPMPRAA